MALSWRRSWAQANAEALRRYLRGLRAAFEFIRDPAKRNEVAAIVAESNGVRLFLFPGRIKLLPLIEIACHDQASPAFRPSALECGLRIDGIGAGIEA